MTSLEAVPPPPPLVSTMFDRGELCRLLLFAQFLLAVQINYGKSPIFWTHERGKELLFQLQSFPRC